MFSGIIEETGKLRGVKKTSGSGEIDIEARKVLEGMKIGDSVSVNGACLTVTKIEKDGFKADLSQETIRKTNLGRLSQLEPVNLERPLKLNQGLSGHLVTGHIDGVGRILSRKMEGKELVLEVEAPPGISEYLIPKGSIAIDGISLTLTETKKDRFKVVIIPHTVEVTNLKHKKVGSQLNLEADIIGKYVKKFTGPDRDTGFDWKQAFEGFS